MKVLFLLIGLVFCNNLFSQIIIQNTQTPAQLVQDVLLGNGINAFNIKFNGQLNKANQIQQNCAQFSSSNGNFFNDGLLLTTGKASLSIGPNDLTSASDQVDTTTLYFEQDLFNLDPQSDLKNGALLEFDFIATGDTLNFNYRFFSEEFPTYSGSSYDRFGLFLSGPGINGTYTNNAENIALLPNGQNVSINNLGPSINQSYYYDNNTNTSSLYNEIQYNGGTIPLTASSSLICGGTYHIKIGIANGSDPQYDSGVFLQAKSFNSNIVSINSNSNQTNAFSDTLLAEGCSSTFITVVRPNDQLNNSYVFHYTSSGTANLNDFTTIPDSLVFNVGVDTILFELIPLSDGINEGTEWIQFNYFSITQCGDTLNDSIRIYIVDRYLTPQLSQTATNSCNNVGSNSANIITNLDYDYFWIGPGNNGDTLNNLNNNNLGGGWYFLNTSVGTCDYIDSIFIPTDSPVTADINAIQLIGNVGETITFTNQSLNASNYNWDFGNGLTSSTTDLSNQTSVYQNSGLFTIYLTAIEQPCNDIDSITIEIFNKPVIVNKPNVFSPNNDEVNETFYIDALYMKELHLVITNRWGNIVFDQTNANPIWNGKYENNKDCEDGVYFFTFKATGLNGEIIEDRGFIQLFNN